MNIFSRIKTAYDLVFSYCDLKWCDNRLTPHKRTITVSCVAFLALIIIFYLNIYRAPRDFPEMEMVTIAEGMSINEVAEYFEQIGVVHSAVWLSALSRIIGDSGGIRAGDYYFKKKKGLGSVARAITTGDYGLEPIPIILYEGFTREQMAHTLARFLPDFDPNRFLELTEGKEGYLFPDTYRFLPSETAEGAARILQKNFFKKITEIQNEIDAFGRPIDDIVIMASLLEREARKMHTKRTIAGILWKRLERGMPLQVDAAFVYILGKGSADLTFDDLATDSPYNTYKYTGLPPGAIANPGIDSLRAAVTPIETDYFYFLSDADGNMHYAETFEEHKQNKARYIW